MKTETQASPALATLAEALEDHRVGLLTLPDPDHGLSSRPMTLLEMDEAGALWMMTSRRTMAARVGAEGCIAHLGFARPSTSDWVSVSGRASLSDDAAKKRDLWSPAGRPWFDGPDDPDMVLLKVVPTHAEIWDGPDSRVSRALAMAASVAAGKPVGLGNKLEIDGLQRGAGGGTVHERGAAKD